MTVKRWTDKMLDELASSVGGMRESITEMRDGMSEMRESITEMRKSIDGLRVTTQALLQVVAQNQRRMELLEQRQAENDERFNVLLEEVRYLIRGNQTD